MPSAQALVVVATLLPSAHVLLVSVVGAIGLGVMATLVKKRLPCTESSADHIKEAGDKDGEVGGDEDGDENNDDEWMRCTLTQGSGGRGAGKEAGHGVAVQPFMSCRPSGLLGKREPPPRPCKPSSLVAPLYRPIWCDPPPRAALGRTRVLRHEEQDLLSPAASGSARAR